jgi:hypothetical protein
MPKEESQEAPIKENPSFTTTTSSSTEANRRAILLQTARAVAMDECGEKSVSVRILLDTGSQRSNVTEQLRSKLKLKSI